MFLDVTAVNSIEHAVKILSEKIDALDILINNAGTHFGPPPPIAEESVENIRRIFDVNTFGPLLVTQAFLPLIRKSKAGRIVMVSSGLGSIAETLSMKSENWNVGFAGYCTSKTALHMLTVKFAKELIGENIKVNAADPELTATDLTGQMGDRNPDLAAEVIVKLATLNDFGPTGGLFRIDSVGNTLKELNW